jgi:hypothetical protein
MFAAFDNALTTQEESMNRNRLVRVWLIAATIAVALPPSSVLAHSSKNPVSIKDIMCAAVQCSKGTTKCADVKGEMKDPTGRGLISVTWYCYEGVVGGGEWEM